MIDGGRLKEDSRPRPERFNHQPSTASHEIDGVRKEKERLTAAWTSHTFGLTAHLVWILSQLNSEYLLVAAVTLGHKTLRTLMKMIPQANDSDLSQRLGLIPDGSTFVWRRAASRFIFP